MYHILRNLVSSEKLFSFLSSEGEIKENSQELKIIGKEAITPLSFVQGLQRHRDHVNGDGEDGGDRHVPRPARPEGRPGSVHTSLIT